MKHLRFGMVALAAASMLVIGASGALAATHSSSSNVRIAVATSNLGRILVDGRGHTLYLFEKDKHGTSACNGQCAAYWPPLIVSGKPLVGTGAKASLVGTTKRADGRLQATYNHHPLYFFVKDTKKGQTTGEGVNGFGAEWYAVSPAGATVEKSSTSSTSSGSGGYKY